MSQKLKILLLIIAFGGVVPIEYTQAHGDHFHSAITLAAHIAEHIEQLEHFLNDPSVDEELIAQQQLEMLTHSKEYARLIEVMPVRKTEEERIVVSFIQNNQLFRQTALNNNFTESLIMLKNMEKLVTRYENKFHKVF